MKWENGKGKSRTLALPSIPWFCPKEGQWWQGKAKQKATGTQKAKPSKAIQPMNVKPTIFNFLSFWLVILFTLLPEFNLALPFKRISIISLSLDPLQSASAAASHWTYFNEFGVTPNLWSQWCSGSQLLTSIHFSNIIQHSLNRINLSLSLFLFLSLLPYSPASILLDHFFSFDLKTLLFLFLILKY